MTMQSSPAETAPALPNCIVCGRIVDPREPSEGGDPHGSMFSEEGDWVCSGKCWDRAIAEGEGQ